MAGQLIPMIGSVGRLIMKNKKARQALAGMAGGALGFLGGRMAKPKAPKQKAVKRSMRFNKDLATTTEARATGKMAEFNRKMREGHKKRGIKVNKRGRASLR
tara:strand:+ start:901 stop:1206 length:306 start_codon:yes stop_codon:yes gene_type:complete